MSRILATIVCVFFGISGYSQFFSWIDNGGGAASDLGYAVAVDGAGNVYSTGILDGNATALFGGTSGTLLGGYDMFVTKSDRYGSTKYFQVIGTSGNETARALDADGGTLVMGGDINGPTQFGTNLSSSQTTSFFVASYDTSGNNNWVFTADSVLSTSTPSVNDVRVVSGDVYATGYFYDDVFVGGQQYTGVAGIKTPFILKLNSAGVLQNFHVIPTTLSSESYTIDIDGQGNVIVGGKFRGTLTDGSVSLTSNGNTDMFIIKYSSSMNPIWAKKMGSSGGDAVLSLSVNQGNLVIGGFYSGTVNVGIQNIFSKGSQDGFYALLDTSSNVQWIETFGGPKSEICNSVEISTSNKIAIGSYLNELATLDGKAYLTKKLLGFIKLVDITNKTLKLRTLSEDTHQDIVDVEFIDDDEIAVVGNMIGDTKFEPYGTLKTNGKKDFFVGKFRDCSGVVPAPLAASGNTTFCRGDSVILSTTAINQKTHRWIRNSQIINGETNSSLTVKENGFYRIIIESDGCEDTSKVIQVSVNSVPHAAISTFPTVCEGMDSILLNQGTPTGGVFSGPGVGGTNRFGPQIGQGKYKLFYTVTNQFGCVDVAERNMVVDSVPGTNLDTLPHLCSHDTLLKLKGGKPNGGVYSGVGVVNGIFNAHVGYGVHDIIYTVSTATGCAKSDTARIHVDSLPKIEIPALENQCLFDGIITLDHAIPAGGTYIGGGVTGNVFDPTQTGIGTFWLTYQFTDVTGCSNSNTSTITVVDAPKPELIDSVELCYKTPLQLTLPLAYSQYIWKNGATDAVLDVSAEDLIVGQQYIGVTVFDEFGCSGEDSTLVTVDYCQTLEIYPNPSLGWLNINVNTFTQEEVRVKIISPSGSIVADKMVVLNAGENNLAIDLYSEYSGIYLMLIEFDDRYYHRQFSLINNF